VSVVPGMVLPIQDEAEVSGPRQIVKSSSANGHWWLWDDHGQNATITLPPDAKPGMWAVQLRHRTHDKPA
jgi:hypothetical protein